ncbi:3-keto-disaccharide hydrolase [Maribacter sp. CXY002]|uniref:3-keto-disaccharide hydrolase n=1 Tax=Maribacter luteocoastalis TaxID=3407671 RepID=UPI003B66D9B3
MKNLGFIVLLLSTVGAVNAQKIDLFNGENLDNWTIYGTEKWYVEDGLLVCESGPDAGYGYLATNEFYKNFILELDFKQEANGNSGVFIRSTVDGTLVSGWQVEVAPPGLFTGGIYESYGRKWLIKPNLDKDKALKFGDWNHMKIMVNGDNITTWLNGTEMITLDDKIIGEGQGSILLQIHDGGGIKVRWKNIELTMLD